MDLKEIGKVDLDRSWYYIYKSDFIITQTKKVSKKAKVLFDIGAGSGYFARKFVEKQLAEKAYCIDPFYTEGQLGIKNGLTFVHQPPKLKPHLLLMIDVLEHVPDDLKLLKEYTDRAEVGAIIVISVPAFMALWSNHDVYLEHFRRYKLKQLQILVHNAGLEELHSSYIFGSIFPLVYVIRKFRKNGKIDSDLKQNSVFVNKIILGYLKLEKIFPVNRFCGTSAFIVARKV